MRGNGRRHGRAAVAAFTLGVVLTATTSGASSALTVPQLPVQPPTVPKLPALPKLPSTPVPSVPDVTAPSAPSTPQLQSTPSLRSGGGGGAPSTGAAPAPGSAPAAGAAPVTAGGGAVQTGGPGSGSGARSAATPRERRARTVKARRERRFQRAARKLEPCLFALAGFDRRVIVLRGGYGGRRPLSSARVARRLHASTRRVRVAERRALRTLRATHRTHGCLGSSTAITVAAIAAPAESGGAQPLLASGSTQLATAAGSSSEPRNGGKGATGDVLDAHASKGSPAPRPKRIKQVSEASSGPPLAVALGLLLLVFLAVGAALVLFARRRGTPISEPQAAPAPVAAAPPSPAPAQEPPPAAAPEPPAEPRSPDSPAPAPAQRRNVRSRTAIGLAASMASVAAGYLVRRRRR